MLKRPNKQIRPRDYLTLCRQLKFRKKGKTFYEISLRRDK